MSAGIFAKISQKKIASVLENLHQFIELPVQLIDGNGDLVLSYGESPRYCKLLMKSLFPGQKCFAIHVKAGQRAQKLGEPYIFSCHANLNHIAYPLINKKELLGCIIIGPFLMDVPDSTLISGLAEKYDLPTVISLELYDELSTLQVIHPSRVNQLSKLVDNLLSPLLPAEQALLKQTQEKLYQQSRINEAIQMYKEQGYPVSDSFFYAKEKELLTSIRTGNLESSKALLNELIGHVLLNKGGKRESVRLYAIELTTLLSRVAIEGGASADSVYPLNAQFLTLLIQEKEQEEICFLLQDVAESFVDAMFSRKDQGNIHVRKALQYISANYTQKLTLAMVAQEVELSPNHFSAVFSTVMGMGFREYLCQVRIEESKRLLLSTDYSLAEIAASLGFPDQSYFSKVFKRIVGISPGSFRN